MDAFYNYVVDENQRDVLKSFQTMALSSGGLAEGTGAATIKTASAVDYAISGQHQSQKGATDNIDMTPDSGGVEIADNYTAILAVFLNSSGGFSTKLGQAKATGDGEDLCLPDFDPESLCCVGAVKLINASGDTVTVGTDDIGDTSDLSATYYNFYHVLPYQVLAEA